MLLGAPGIASPALVSALCSTLDAHPSSRVTVRTFDLDSHGGGAIAPWLTLREWPAKGYALIDEATSDILRVPPFRWLDPVERPENVVVPRSDAIADLGTRRGASSLPMDLCRGRERVQLVGDGVARPVPARRERSEQSSGSDVVDPTLRYFGCVQQPGAVRVARPKRYARARPPKLSVIVVVHDMRREAPRTIQSLLPAYQRGISSDEYEIIVVDNGSDAPLEESEVHAIAPLADYVVLADAPPSPARAINVGVSRASGDALAIMVDGACLLSPGVLAEGLSAFKAFPRPIVITRYFFLGPGDQMDTIQEGYDRSEEDRLLAGIEWPSDGYRLFDIASPDALGKKAIGWLTGWFESNCLFLPRSVFDELGGYDEQFDFPGGGYLNVDVLVRALALEGVQPVQLVGEGVFHQVHGGITTNVPRRELEANAREYHAQYVELRGKVPDLRKTNYFSGRLASPATRQKMLG